MTYAEVKAAGLTAGLTETQAYNAALWLTRDNAAPTAEQCAAHFEAVKNRKPRRPRLTEGLRFLTTPEENFGIRPDSKE